ncbi:hypothetical protein Tco_1086197 [Tanacetum coccineum]
MIESIFNNSAVEVARSLEVAASLEMAALVEFPKICSNSVRVSIEWELAEIIQAMLANNNIEDIAEVIRAFVNNNEATKKRKHEDNLIKWSDVIDVDALPDNVTSENNNVTNLTPQEPDIPMVPFKRKKKDQIKITERTRLCRLFNEDSSDQEEDLDEDVSDQEEDLDEEDNDQEDSDDGWV